jgi:hypothetical protein
MLLAAAQRLPQAHHNREEGIKRDASPAKPQKNSARCPEHGKVDGFFRLAG